MKEFWFTANDFKKEEDRWKMMMMFDGENVWMPLAFCGDEEEEYIKASMMQIPLRKELDHYYVTSSWIERRLVEDRKFELASMLHSSVASVKVRADSMGETNKLDLEGATWFVCYWCNEEQREQSSLNHSCEGRSCCKRCYRDKKSNFHLVYGRDATVESEAKEVRGVKLWNPNTGR